MIHVIKLTASATSIELSRTFVQVATYEVERITNEGRQAFTAVELLPNGSRGQKLIVDKLVELREMMQDQVNSMAAEADSAKRAARRTVVNMETAAGSLAAVLIALDDQESWIKLAITDAAAERGPSFVSFVGGRRGAEIRKLFMPMLARSKQFLTKAHKHDDDIDDRVAKLTNYLAREI